MSRARTFGRAAGSFAVASLASGLAVGSVHAQTPAPEPTYPTVTVGALSYLQYDYELRNQQDFNAFDVTRAYININGLLAKNVKFRLTPDISRVTDGSLSGSLMLRLKYGFVEFDDFTPHSWLRVGLHQTPWLDFEESIDRYRVQGTMFAEREGIIPGSGDFGVGYMMPFPSEYGEVQAGVYNGEGFKVAEKNKYKSIQGRLTVRPFPNRGIAHGFRLTGFYDWGWFSEDHRRQHAIAMGSFEHKNLVATAQWLVAHDQPADARVADTDGFSAFLELRQGTEGAALFARYDWFDTNTDTQDNSKSRLISGLAYWLRWQKVKLGLIVDDEYVSYDAAGKPDDNRILAQTHVQF